MTFASFFLTWLCGGRGEIKKKVVKDIKSKEGGSRVDGCKCKGNLGDALRKITPKDNKELAHFLSNDVGECAQRVITVQLIYQDGYSLE